MISHTKITVVKLIILISKERRFRVELIYRHCMTPFNKYLGRPSIVVKDIDSYSGFRKSRIDVM